MHNVVVFLIAQFCFLFGLAGLFWPDKFLGVFDVLMFPFPASYQTVRNHCVGAIVLSLLLGALLVAG